jgi:hypothetical protein
MEPLSERHFQIVAQQIGNKYPPSVRDAVRAILVDRVESVTAASQFQVPNTLLLVALQNYAKQWEKFCRQHALISKTYALSPPLIALCKELESMTLDAIEKKLNQQKRKSKKVLSPKKNYRRSERQS